MSNRMKYREEGTLGDQVAALSQALDGVLDVVSEFAKQAKLHHEKANDLASDLQFEREKASARLSLLEEERAKSETLRAAFSDRQEGWIREQDAHDATKEKLFDAIEQNKILREALRDVIDLPYEPNCSDGWKNEEAVMAKAKAALRGEGGEG